MKRREFLRLFGIGAAAVAAAPAIALQRLAAPSGPMVVAFDAGALAESELLMQRYIAPAVAHLAAQIDAQLLRHFASIP